MLKSFRRALLVIAAPIAVLASLVAGFAAVVYWQLIPQLNTALGTPSPTALADPLGAAWDRARASESYKFNGDVVQVTLPSAIPANVGRSSRTDQFHLEGQTNLLRPSLEMQLWPQSGSATQAETGIGVKVEGGKTYRRQTNGEWQEDSSLSTEGIAPQGDFLAFLKATKDVVAHAPETRAGLTFRRYSFQIDGPAFAVMVRDQMEASLRQKGELLPGARLDVPAYYRHMTGQGELWVREGGAPADGAQAGLPLRQILTLRFPEQGNQSIHAQITINFLDYVQPAQTGLMGTLLPLPAHFAQLPLGVLALMALAGVLALLRFHTSRRLQRSLTFALIASLLLGPALTGIKTGTVLDAQTARAAAQAEQQNEVNAAAVLREIDQGAVFNPHQDPVEAAEKQTLAEARLAASTLRVGASAIAAPANVAADTSAAQSAPTDNGTDSDADGLTDFAEARLSTSEIISDTDQDDVPDGIEAKGFQFGGKTWYLNPGTLDSNNDGIGDGEECWNTPPTLNTAAIAVPACDLDTDADGTPDTLDADNDNDDVPDQIDLAPFSVSPSAYNNGSPLRLTLNNLAVNTPTFVDFQIRPLNPQHLAFAFNVLDWPRDSKGQVTDVDNATWANLAAAQGRTAAANDAFGDMKLVPMLEIRVAGAPTNLPPQSDLTPYNITVNDYTEDGSTQIVYVPLSVQTDDKTGNKVAFTGRMRYLSSGTWPTPHDVRLIWAVQALVDVPCDPKAADAAARGCPSDGFIRNQPQVIQSYYDDYKLAGLNVSENHGAQTAILYEDPAVDANLNDDPALSAVSMGLDNAFLGGRDADGNGQRDITVDEIARRFDHTANTGVSSNERWGLDGALNTLRVVRHDYATFDQAVIFTAMTETTRLLSAVFDSSWAANNALKPTLMFAYEQRSRSLGLDAARASGGYVGFSNNNITLNMQPSGQNKAPLITLAGLKWAHYCRINGSPVWELCPGDVYWTELENRYGNAPALPGYPADPDVAAGVLFVAHQYDLVLSQGVNSAVQQDTTVTSGRYSQDSDTATADFVRTGVLGAAPLIVAVSNQVLMAKLVNKITVTQQLGITIRRLVAGKAGRLLLPKNLATSPRAQTRVAKSGAAALALLGATLYLASQGNTGAKITLKVLVIGLQTVMAVVDPIMTARAWAEAMKAGGTALKLTSSVEAIGVSKYAGAIGAGIAVAVVWGFFIYSMVSNHVSAFSPEFNRALAETIAATIYIIVLAVLSATLVGAILVGIISVIDAILTAICESGVRDLRKVPGLGGACFTLGTTVIKGIAYFLYNYDLMIETDRADLVAPGNPSTQLADPTKGLVTGNPLSIGMPITTHAVHKSPDIANGIFINAYLWLFSKDNLRSSTFKYSLTQPNKEDITNVSRDQMSGAWQNVGTDHKYALTPMYGGTATTTPAPVNFASLPAGINRAAEFYLNMGYALPAYECWGIPILFGFYPIPVCYTRTFKGNSSSKVDSLVYDIFPASLGEFMTLTNKRDSGLGLAWDTAFPSLWDADGDGLIVSARGGLDPDDRTADTDRDGLADAYELDRRAAGVNVSPITCDSDGDRLTDAQEAVYGTNAGIADTDNDGLADGDEVWHPAYDTGTCQANGTWAGGWAVTINAATPFIITVSSDPTQTDGDGDGISDQAERELASLPDVTKRIDKKGVPYHPNIANVPPVAVYVEADKRFVLPGQSFAYTTTVIASVAMAPGVLNVSAPAALGAAPLPAALPFDLLTFSGAQTLTHPSTFNVPNGTGSQALSLNSTALVRLPPIGPATLKWDPFTFQSLGSTGFLYNLMAAAPSAPDRQDTYLAATVATSEVITRGGNGFVQVKAIPGGQASTVFTPGPSLFALSQMGNNKPSVACNNSGTCMTVWDFHLLVAFSPAEDRIQGAITGPTGQVVATVLPNDLYGSVFNPRVTTDGTNFLVAFENTPVDLTNPNLAKETYIKWTLYSPSGTILRTSQSRIETTRTWPQYRPGVGLDVAWIGSRYRIAWKFIRDRFDYQLIGITDVDQGGNLIATSPGAYGSDVTGDNTGTPAIAYDPAGDHTLIIWKYPNTNVHYVLTRGTALYPASGGGPMGPASSSGFGFNISTQDAPYVVYNPVVNGFLVSAGGRLHLMTTDLSNRYLTEYQTVRNNGDVPITCPLPGSVPVGDYRFEDAPASTSFLNTASVGGNHATCSGNTCPASGFAGATDLGGLAVGSPASDYSLRFDGVDDVIRLDNRLGSEFSVAFWYKSANAAGPSFSIASNPNNGFGINIAAGSTEFFAGGARAGSTTSLLDGQWHYVVATRSRAGALAVYLDGNPTPIATAASAATPIMDGAILIGGGSTPVNLDNLQLYNTALTGSSVQALYQRSMQSYCLGLSNPRSYEWAKLSVYPPDTRGGKITASNSLTVTVDAEGPSSRVTSIGSGEYIKGNQTLIIGGEASDSTSGVAGVEVTVGAGGNFVPANGANTWAYALTVTDGDYFIRSRATDIAGNIESPTNGNVGLVFYADAGAPTVSVNALPATPIQPARNAAGDWAVGLSGSAVDVLLGGGVPGSGVDFVEVRLVGQDGLVSGNGWQTATLNGNNWAISYRLPSAVSDSTGAYTVSVRATDLVGNASADDAATATLLLDGTGPAASLSEVDASREFITNTLTIGGLITDMGSAGVDTLDVAFTSVDKIAALPTDISSDQAEAQLNRTWIPATLAQRGAGITQTTWSVQVPMGLENLYQIDVRGTDLLGNRLATSSIWRGIIDNLAPRVAVAASTTGNSYVDLVSDQRYYETTYTCAAVDQYLDDTTFACAGNALQPPTRVFTTSAALQALFPDLTIRVGLYNTYTLWQTSTQPLATISACDGYTHCASARTQPLVSVLSDDNLVAALDSDFQAIPASQASLSLPTSMVIAPTQQSYVAATGVVTGVVRVTIVAATAQPMKEIAVTLDGAVVATIPFAQSPGITETQLTVPVMPTGEGLHIVFARATDWAGNVQATTFPVSFKLDLQPPVVTLDTDPLTISDTYQLGSGILRFHGTAQDSVGLAAVQIKVNDSAYEDAAFGNGVWSTAVAVEDPEGKTLSVTVRAMDFAGQISTQSANIGTALSANDAPETGITSSPIFASVVNTATFSFVGTSNVRDVPAFECQLDMAEYVPCASPFDLLNLSNGSHVFHVRGVDSAGNVDLSPASYTWIVDVPTLKTTIASGPAQTSTTRSASFVFSGAASSVGFECSLDGAEYAACTSPQVFENLAYGEHGFAVRANNGVGTVGASTRFVWTVVNTPPVAGSQVLSMIGGNALSITLAVTDVDALGYKLGTPAHGVLQGIPPNLIYTPDTSFFGVDSFTFSANDGLVDSNLATISITVIPPDREPPTTTITLSPAVATGINGWYTRSVGVVVSATDGTDSKASGVAQIRCALDPITSPVTFADLQASCAYTSTGGLVSDDGVHTVYAASRDGVGNAGLSISKTFKVDTTAPVVSLTGVLSGATYLLGGVPVAACVTSDPTSGVAVSSTLSTSGANAHGAGRLTSTCSVATDKAGNTSALVRAQYTVTYDAKTFVVLGREGVAIDQLSTIVKGSVGTNLISSGPYVAGNVELNLSQKTVMQDPAGRVLANRIAVGPQSTLYNPGYSTLTGAPTVLGMRATSVTLPLVANFPTLPTVTPGTQNITLVQNIQRALAAGTYAALKTDQNSVITFTGGIYHFASWEMAQNARLYFAAPSEIRIAGRIKLDQNSFIGPAPGASNVTAKNIVIYVAGQNGSNGALSASPKAVLLSQNTVINANLIAPNGTIQLDQKVTATGALVGRWVNVAQMATLKLESGLP